MSFLVYLVDYSIWWQKSLKRREFWLTSQENRKAILLDKLGGHCKLECQNKKKTSTLELSLRRTWVSFTRRKLDHQLEHHVRVMTKQY